MNRPNGLTEQNVYFYDKSGRGFFKLLKGTAIPLLWLMKAFHFAEVFGVRRHEAADFKG